MSGRKETTRLGMVGLLMLVIGLCLAVLGALALVTAHSEAVLSERHEDAVWRAERAEAAAQEFLAEADGWLARTVDAEPASAANRSFSTVAASAEAALPTMVDAVLADKGSEVLGGELTIDAAVLSSEELTPLLGERAELDEMTYPCGIRALFTVDAVRTLSLVIAVRGDMTFDIVENTLTTEWTDAPSDLRLWEG